MNKINQLPVPTGLFFDDFNIGQILEHGVPRTITQADATLYTALTGSRFALHCASTVAQKAGFDKMPIDNMLLFHIAFGKTVNDISLNAVANLGYAEVMFQHTVFADDTISVTSEVIGLKENSNGKNGVVYVHSVAKNQNEIVVLSFKRWVMVHKAAGTKSSSIKQIPELQGQVCLSKQTVPANLDTTKWKSSFSDNQRRAGDFNIGDRIFHRDGITINDSDHSLATRLYQNNARVHFDQHLMNTTPNGKRLVYGGHIISLCRALSYNGLGNAIWLTAIHEGSHCNPSFAGDTIYCQSDILDINDIEGRTDLAKVKLRMFGLKNNTPDNIDVLVSQENGRIRYHKDVVLDITLSVLMIK